MRPQAKICQIKRVVACGSPVADVALVWVDAVVPANDLGEERVQIVIVCRLTGVASNIAIWIFNAGIDAGQQPGLEVGRQLRKGVRVKARHGDVAGMALCQGCNFVERGFQAEIVGARRDG